MEANLPLSVRDESQVSDMTEGPPTPLPSSPIEKNEKAGKTNLGYSDLPQNNARKEQEAPQNGSNEFLDNAMDGDVKQRLFQLDSSPLKSQCVPKVRNCKKTVAFSEQLVVNSPEESPAFLRNKDSTVDSTPRKSILKSSSSNDINMKHIESPLSSKSGRDKRKQSADNPSFWQQGHIVQLEPNSAQIPSLIKGCVSVLGHKHFSKRFEVYATLNHIIKTNSFSIIAKVLISKPITVSSPDKKNRVPGTPGNPDGTSYLQSLCTHIRRDIISIEDHLFSEDDKENSNTSRNDPFLVRTLCQSLKLVNSLITDPELNQHISLEDKFWFYEHACTTIVKEEITKTLAIPYLSIIKDVRQPSRKKRQTIEVQETIEKFPLRALESLIEMKSFASSSIIIERFHALKNLILNFPSSLQQCIDKWLQYYLFNLCDYESPFFSKYNFTGLSIFNEIINIILENEFYSGRFSSIFSMKVTRSIRSISYDGTLIIPEITHGSELKSAIVLVLNSLRESQHYRFAMEIWSDLSFLMLSDTCDIDHISGLGEWFQVHQDCLSSGNISVQLSALSCWKKVGMQLTKKVCDCLISRSDDNQNSPHKSDLSKTVETSSENSDLILYMFHILEPNTSDTFDAIHGNFLCILYTILNSFSTSITSKYLHVFWDKIISPILVNFYFRKLKNNQDGGHLGTQVLTHLLKTQKPTTRKYLESFKTTCNETIGLNEINTLTPKWVFYRSDRVLDTITAAIKQKEINADIKLDVLHAYFNNIRSTVRNEMKQSANTNFILERTYLILESLFELHDLDAKRLQRLTSMLLFTFDISGFPEYSSISKKDVNIFQQLIIKSSDILDERSLFELLDLIYNHARENQKLDMLLFLESYDINSNMSLFKNFTTEKLKSKKIDKSSKAEIEFARRLFRTTKSGFETPFKRLIQDLVLLKLEDFENYTKVLGVSEWTLPVFKYFIELLHNAPHNSLKQLTLNLIIQKWEDDQMFIDVFKFLVSSKFDLEIYNLKANLMKKYKTLQGFYQFQFRSMWKQYLTDVHKTGNLCLLDELLSLSLENGLDTQNYGDIIKSLPKTNEIYSAVTNASTHSTVTKSPNQRGKENSRLEINDTNENLKNNTKSNSPQPPMEEEKHTVEVSRVANYPEVNLQTHSQAHNQEASVKDINKNFDIHSFTAMLNAQLTTSAKSRKSNIKGNGRREQKGRGGNSKRRRSNTCSDFSNKSAPEISGPESESSTSPDQTFSVKEEMEETKKLPKRSPSLEEAPYAIVNEKEEEILSPTTNSPRKRSNSDNHSPTTKKHHSEASEVSNWTSDTTGIETFPKQIPENQIDNTEVNLASFSPESSRDSSVSPASDDVELSLDDSDISSNEGSSKSIIMLADSVTDKELLTLNDQDRHTLETSLLKLMLRMKQTSINAYAPS
ncbi:Piso0_002178 [Millerozyma farinosa CBS 7064]|uniref:Piso0_002178 protein n=1 Tax=Pichia sorbitophila (strain ATCC MYA-4447 / BCRC 22081 / CBS 7064 / NBRC 10061 / NRRL Y-12695) TaxID=559304 RepID=G8YBX0_PICSO|nr:Piso0_002178 [Millerozyma farinosa CBS 7064]